MAKKRKVQRDENGILAIEPRAAAVATTGTVQVPINTRFQMMMGGATHRMSGIIDEMQSPDKFLSNLKETNARRHDIVMPNSRELNLGYNEKEGQPRGYFIEPDYKKFPSGSPMRDWFGENKRMYFSVKGIESAAHLINRSLKTFDKFDNPRGRFINEFNDWFRPNSDRQMILRTNFGPTHTEKHRFVDAIVDGRYNTVTNHDLMAATMTNLNAVYGDCLRGVQVLKSEDNDEDNSGYRLIFGEPLLKESASDSEEDAQRTIWLMLNYRGSDSGLEDTHLSLSLWRMICANGAMRHDVNFLRAKWNRFDSESKFLNKVGTLISNAGLFGRYMTKQIEQLQNTKLTIHPAQVLSSLYQQHLIDLYQHDAAHYKASQMGKGSTCYDFLNLLTDSAKIFPQIRRREKAESTAMAIAMQPNSFNGVAISGFDRRARIFRHSDMVESNKEVVAA